jgi:hydrogenase maturation protease
MKPFDVRSPVVVAGFGSEYRLDDGVGPIVASLVGQRCSSVFDIGPLADPLDLLGNWNGAELAIVIDATRSGAPPGTVNMLEITVRLDDGLDVPSVNERGVTSTHGIGLEGVLRLATVIDQAPRRLVLVGIEGEHFGNGVGLSTAVHDAVPGAVQQVVELIAEVT